MTRPSPVEQLRQAVTVKGQNPMHHDRIMARHRAEWPTLWRAIDRILNEEN